MKKNYRMWMFVIITQLFFQHSWTQIINMETPHPDDDVSEFIYDIGGIRFKSGHLNFGFINKGDTAVKVLECFNSMNIPVEIQFLNTPHYVSIEPGSKEVLPNKIGKFTVKYITTLNDDWDVVVDRLYLKLNNEEWQNDKFTITANIREDFSKIEGKEILNLPVAYFKEKRYNFGEAGQAKEIKHNFILQNTGNEELIIRKLKTCCGCTVIKPKKMKIAPGKKAAIKVIFNPQGFKGHIKKTVTVITNDPEKYKQYLRLEGDVMSN